MNTADIVQSILITRCAEHQASCSCKNKEQEEQEEQDQDEQLFSEQCKSKMAVSCVQEFSEIPLMVVKGNDTAWELFTFPSGCVCY